MSPQVRVETSRDIATVYLARTESRGALTTVLLEEFSHVLSGVAEDPGLRAVVLRSSNPDVFSPGMDLKEMRSLSQDGLRQTLQAEETVLHRLENLPMPTIAAVSGLAFGGGFSLAAACDIRIADETASFGLPMARLGLMPSANMVQRFVATIGPARTKELLLRGRPVSAATAERWGLVNQVVRRGELDAAVAEWIADIRRGAPAATRAGKRSVNLCVPLTASHNIPPGPPYFVEPTEFQEGTTAFSEHREPNWDVAVIPRG